MTSKKKRLNQNYFKNIKTTEIFNNNKYLIIFFPSAAYTPVRYQNFIRWSSLQADTIIIDGGYLGISNIKRDIKEYKVTSFINSFYQFYQKKIQQYQKVIIIAQSVGTIYGLYFHKKVPKSNLILLSPTLTDQRFNVSRIYLLVLKLFRFELSQRLLLNIIKLPIINNRLQRYFNVNYPSILHAINKVGIKSYVMCLNEISIYGIVKSKLDENTILIYGKNDQYIYQKCKIESFLIRQKTHVVDGGHSLIQDHLEDIVKILKKENII